MGVNNLQAITAMTKINIIDSVKKFHGRENENVNLWFDRYEVILEIAGSSSEAAKLMPLFLEDAAYTTWRTKLCLLAEREHILLIE